MDIIRKIRQYFFWCIKLYHFFFSRVMPRKHIYPHQELCSEMGEKVKINLLHLSAMLDNKIYDCLQVGGVADLSVVPQTWGQDVGQGILTFRGHQCGNRPVSIQIPLLAQACLRIFYFLKKIYLFLLY